MVGERAAKLLADRFQSIDALMNATTEELIEVSEIGPKVAEAVTFHFSVPANRERIEKMKRLGLRPAHTATATGDRLAGKTVVVTGTLNRFSRDEIHKLIEREGGKAGHITFEHVWFAYNPSDAGEPDWVLKDVSFGLVPLTPVLAIMGLLLGLVAVMLVLRHIGERITAVDPEYRSWRGVIGRVLAKTSLAFMVIAAHRLGEKEA